MTHLLRAVFFDRLERLQSLEAALDEQTRLLLWDAPRFLTAFKKKVTKARKQIQRLIPVLIDDPLNRFLTALQTAGASWNVDEPGDSDAHAFKLEVKLDDVFVYLRVCQALAENEKPLNIQELKPFIPPTPSRSGFRLGARHLQVLSAARLIAAETEGSGPYVPYHITEQGRELIQAILAN